MDVSEISEQFNLAAKEYDKGRRKFIPCFDAFYRESTQQLATTLSPRKIADLGAGTGLLSMHWFQFFPNARYLLLDAADAMLPLSQDRFAGLTNFTFIHTDYTSASFGGADVIISALSIHHLNDSEKQQLFNRIYAELPNGGQFINYDQFCEDSLKQTEDIEKEWVAFIMKSGLSDAEIARWKERRKLDRECSVNQQADMLRQCGFAPVNLIFKSGKFAVIQAIKDRLT